MGNVDAVGKDDDVTFHLFLSVLVSWVYICIFFYNIYFIRSLYIILANKAWVIYNKSKIQHS